MESVMKIVMKTTVALLVTLVACAHASPVAPAPLELEEDAYLTMPELITKYGYPVETHQVTTEDGYVLTVFRIPYGKNSATRTPNARPAYLQHGLLTCSDDWIIMGPEKGLGYLLADAGYDVWMGNARGNKWSRQHLTLDPDSDKSYWDFSWHEIGEYDLPAVLDYVLETTGAEKVTYAGHSMGTTEFFVMASTRPEYNAKIASMHALAPIAFMPNARTPFLKEISKLVHNKYDVFKLLGVMEFLPSRDIYSMLGERVCADEAFTQEVCANFLFLLCGFDSQELNRSSIPVFMSHNPAGASSKDLIHYAQSINSGYFRQFDYGSVRNLLKYGSRSPPDYDLSKISAPVALHWGENDFFGVPEDTATLQAKLPNLAGSFRVPLDAFNHLDFILAIHVKDLLYDTVIEVMNKY